MESCFGHMESLVWFYAHLYRQIGRPVIHIDEYKQYELVSGIMISWLNAINLSNKVTLFMLNLIRVWQIIPDIIS